MGVRRVSLDAYRQLVSFTTVQSAYGVIVLLLPSSMGDFKLV